MNDYEYQLELLLSSNQSELFYRMLGSTPFVDLFSFGVVSLLAFVSFAVSTFCFVVLLRNKHRHKDLLHKYLLAYVLNNITMSLILSLTFVSFSTRHFPWFYSMFARIHRCIMLKMAAPICLTINRAVEILVICNMLGNFKLVFRQIGNFSWHITFALILIVSSIINLPFLRTVKTDEQLANDLMHFNQNMTFTYCAKDMFYNNIWINNARLAATFLRDLVITSIELVLCVVLIVYFKQFLEAKSRNNLRQACSTPTSNVSNSLRPRDVHFKRTTRTVARFSVVSVVMNFVTFIFFVFLSLTFNSVILTEFFLIIFFITILKPFMTILVLYRIDKNVSNVFCRGHF